MKDIITKMSREHTIILISDDKDILKICSKRLLLQDGVLVGLVIVIN